MSALPQRFEVIGPDPAAVKKGVLHWNGEQILDWYKAAAGDKLK